MEKLNLRRSIASRRPEGTKSGCSGRSESSGSSKTQANSAQQAIRYDRYRLSVREFLLGAGKGAAACGLLSYTFYRDVSAFLILLPFGLAAGAVTERRRRMERRQRMLTEQFKESVMILAGSLSAGYSVENALTAGVAELSALYGRQGLMTREFSGMAQQIRMNRPAEQVLEEFAGRSGIEDVQSFAEVFAVAKRSSGDLGSIMRHTAEVIRDRLQVREEIRTMTASRQFEQKIMNMIPFFLVFYVQSASPGFFDQMYGTLPGRILMTLCLALYLVSCVMSDRILAIGF